MLELFPARALMYAAQTSLDSLQTTLTQSAMPPAIKLNPETREDLCALLERCRIPVAKWGRAGAKDIDDLFDELQGGEAVLIEQGGILLRKIDVARIEVLSGSAEGVRYKLFEDRQVFTHGAVRRRPTAWAVWEKCVAGESASEAARRGLSEELHLSKEKLEPGASISLQEPPMDYPGIPTLITNHDFTAVVEGVDLSAGYVESQAKKSTFFAWRRISGPLNTRAQELLNKTDVELRQLLTISAGRYHRYYLETTQAAGLILAEAFTSGVIGEALSSFDGSSRYLKGALYESRALFSQEKGLSDISFEETGRELERQVTGFAGGHSLSYQESISNWAIINLPYSIDLVVAAHGHQESVHLAFNIETEGRDQACLERARLITAIISLEQGVPRDYRGEVEIQHDSADPLEATIAAVRSGNRELWQQLETACRLSELRMVIGESFTFGKLARLLGDRADEDRLFTAYGWYDRSWKIAAGVPRESCTDALIAQPDTVEKGAIGLLCSIDREAAVSLATSGWANYGQGEAADYFSIAAALRQDQKMLVKSISFEVDASRTYKRDFWRRELTRELGVTASLLVLAEILAEACRETCLDALIMQGKALLERQGTITA